MQHSGILYWYILVWCPKVGYFNLPGIRLNCLSLFFSRPPKDVLCCNSLTMRRKFPQRMRITSLEEEVGPTFLYEVSHPIFLLSSPAAGGFLWKFSVPKMFKRSAAVRNPICQKCITSGQQQTDPDPTSFAYSNV